MLTSLVQQQALQARLNLILGAIEYDRLFLGMEVGGVDGDILFLNAGDENSAAEIEERYALHISTIASQILGRKISFVTVLPKEMSKKH